MLFDYEAGDDYAMVLCPSCRGHNTHHSDVTVFARKTEDSGGERVDITREGRVSQAAFDDHPLGRRSAVAITLWCETCDAGTELQVIQHKGQTMLKVQPTGAPAVKPAKGY